MQVNEFDLQSLLSHISEHKNLLKMAGFIRFLGLRRNEQFNVKAGSDGKLKTTYGFKTHINVNEYGFIKAKDFTAGNVHDSQCFIELLSGEENAAYADSADASEKTNSWLAARRIKNGILERAYRNTPLSKGQNCKTKSSRAFAVVWSGSLGF